MRRSVQILVCSYHDSKNSIQEVVTITITATIVMIFAITHRHVSPYVRGIVSTLARLPNELGSLFLVSQNGHGYHIGTSKRAHTVIPT